jgi:ubiquinone/menaquinone biosynthesis C-methylase UbiE
MYVPRITRDIISDRLIPNDHCRQIVASDYIKEELNKRNRKINVLDLGCGEGESIDLFKAVNPDIVWYGLDIDESPEVLNRTRTDTNFYSYDGVNIPFPANTFDIVYSSQVFEHIRYPEQVIKEIVRVLKSDGCFFGSVSALEPYHSYSLYNYTPYGFVQLLQSSRFKVNELRPSIDCFTLIVRKLLNKPGFFGQFWRKESPFNAVFTIMLGTL